MQYRDLTGRIWYSTYSTYDIPVYDKDALKVDDTAQKCVLPWHFLPALTLAVCRIKDRVTKVVRLEFQSHLFVFHLVDHLCISIVNAHSCTKRTLYKMLSCPQSTKICDKVVLESHKWNSIDFSYSQTGPFWSAPPKPSPQTEVVWAFMKKRRPFDSPRAVCRREAGHASRTWTATRGNRHRKILRSANHRAWKWSGPAHYLL